MRQKHEYYIDGGESHGHDVADWIYRHVCRHDFSQPGFALINLPAIHDSRQLRREMVRLKESLGVIHRTRTGKHFTYTSMGSFDQQVTTKPHRDGGPDESVLMLGYEPTSVRSRLCMADYSKCTFDLGIDPMELLQVHNPMYVEGERMLADYTTWLEGIDSTKFQIVLINNSCVPIQEDRSGMLGVLHQAIIENPSTNATRIVNSTMIAFVGAGVDESISNVDQERFVTTDRISQSVYGD